MALRQRQATDQLALRSVASHQRRAAFTALKEGLAAGHQQLALGLLRIMALEALAFEHGTHLLERDWLGGGEGRPGESEQRENQTRARKHGLISS